MDKSDPDLSYPSGFDTLLAEANVGLAHFIGAEDYFKALGDDIDAMELRRVIPTDGARYRPITIEDKRLSLEDEFVGRSQLLLMHALTIAVLRRADPPPQAIDLFIRMWTEKADFLLAELNTRWITSALTTFADYGQTEIQRRLGSSMTILLGLLKFCEAERSLTGLPLHRPVRRTKGDKRQRLGLGMEPYSLLNGDVDRNVLLRIWADANHDDVVGAPVKFMLNKINADKRNVFRRMMLLRARKQAEAEKALVP